MFDFYNTNLRILNFTHIDFDGVASAIVIKNFYDNVMTEQINYSKEQIAYDKICANRDNVDAVIFTDFCPINLKQLQKLGKPILVLDHHESCISFNNPEHDIYINTKYCGAMLAWKYFSIKKDLSYLADFINVANDYDLFTLKDPRSMYYNALYWAMGFQWFMHRFIKGNMNLYREEQDYILWYKNDVQRVYDELPLSDLPHKGCFYNCDKYMAEISARLRADGYDYQLIYHGRALSLRSNSDQINLVELCRRMGRGGGHRCAAGIGIEEGENVSELVQRIVLTIEQMLAFGDEMPF